MGAGKKIQGRVRATASSGTPRYVGDINWSKRLTVMVSFRFLCLGFLCFVGMVHLEKYEL